MKLAVFRIDKETERGVAAIVKLKRPKIKKGTYYRDAVQRALQEDQKKLQQLSKSMNK